MSADPGNCDKSNNVQSIELKMLLDVAVAQVPLAGHRKKDETKRMAQKGKNISRRVIKEKERKREAGE